MEKIDLPSCDDTSLVLRMMDEDEEALRELLRRSGGQVKGVLRNNYGNTLDDHQIDEAINVAAFKAWRSAHTFDDTKGSLGGWFLRIAINAAIDIIRGEERHTNVYLDYDPDFDPAKPHWEEPDETLSDKEQKKLLASFDRAVDSLPSLQKAIILADLQAGEKADDHLLAETHGTSINSIRVSRSKAKLNFKKSMDR